MLIIKGGLFVFTCVVTHNEIKIQPKILIISLLGYKIM